MPQTTFNTIDSTDVSGKRVLVRVDLNVPMKKGCTYCCRNGANTNRPQMP